MKSTLTLVDAELKAKQEETEYGGKIEKKIRPLVVALLALGFPTSGSCEGHVKDNFYPWILFVTNGNKKNSRKIKKSTKKQISELIDLLNEFYYQRDVPEDQRLDVIFEENSTPFCFYHLQPRGAKLLDMMPYEVFNETAKKQILHRHQSEVKAFTKFLHSKITT